MTPVEKLLRDLVALLERENLPYAIMGGMAVRAHGLPRPTYDVDVTVAIDREDLPSLFGKLDSLGYDVSDQYLGGWLDSVAEMPLFKATTFAAGLTVSADIFVAENVFQKNFLDRRVRDSIEDLQAWFVSAEDLILLKLIADRYRDRVDVQDVMAMRPKLDDAYLDLWADKLRVTDRLAAAREEFRNS